MSTLTNQDSSESFKLIISWTILALLGLLVGSFAAYVLITGMISLIISFLNAIKQVVIKLKLIKVQAHARDSIVSQDLTVDANDLD